MPTIAAGKPEARPVPLLAHTFGCVSRPVATVFTSIGDSGVRGEYVASCCNTGRSMPRNNATKLTVRKSCQSYGRARSSRQPPDLGRPLDRR